MAMKSNQFATRLMRTRKTLLADMISSSNIKVKNFRKRSLSLN